jgi:hypothetical protein
MAKNDYNEKIFCPEGNMPTKKIIVATLVILLSMLACQAVVPPGNDPQPPTDVYLGLRNIWFTSGPEQAGVTPEPDSKIPYAIVMDIGFDEGTATIVSSIAGDGSMYISNGGGIIGGIEHENVRKASIKFVKAAGDIVDKMKLVTEFPLPAADNVKFYVITPSGVYSTDEFNADLLASGDYELSSLFLAGNDVITELRITNGD